MSRLLEKLVDIFIIKLVELFKRKIDEYKTRLANKSAVNQAQEAETDEELERAAKNLSDRFDTD